MEIVDDKLTDAVIKLQSTIEKGFDHIIEALQQIGAVGATDNGHLC